MKTSRLNTGARFAPRFTQLGRVVRWLRGRGLSRLQISSLFGESVSNVGVVAHREQPIFTRNTNAPAFGALSLRDQLAAESNFEETEPVRHRTEGYKVEQLEEKIETLVSTYAREYRFAEALGQLNRLRPLLGRPRDPSRTRLLSKWQYHRTWFLTNCGMDASAIRSADSAFQQEAIRYRVSRLTDALLNISAVGLLATNSYLARDEPALARKCLSLVVEATTAANARLDSGYYYHLGAVNMREGNNNEAQKHFETARRVWQERTQRDVLTIGTRQLNLLQRNFDRSQEALASVGSQFLPSSLEVSIHVNWTAACAFNTDSPAAHTFARDVLESHVEHSTDFGSQSTKAYLLRLTPELPKSLWPSYSRFVLSQNAFRNS